jgi:DNA polymerase I-like protein with 3'-5' exonuclease and polymerase domains
VQGTLADITKTALRLLHDKLKNTGIKIIACIHDEIIMEAPEDEAEIAGHILKDSMIEAGQAYLKNVYVVVDVRVVDNWKKK